MHFFLNRKVLLKNVTNGKNQGKIDGLQIMISSECTMSDCDDPQIKIHESRWFSSLHLQVCTEHVLKNTARFWFMSKRYFTA